jgi:Na+-transporting methylmalonyl-CoA/oxaloacetate decarboxylase beta subunit
VADFLVSLGLLLQLMLLLLLLWLSVHVLFEATLLFPLAAGLISSVGPS